MGTAACGLSSPQRASLASNRRRDRRFHNGRLRPIIETANAVHRVRAWATSGALPSTDAQPGQKAGERCWKPGISRERNAFRVRPSAAVAHSDLEPRLQRESNRPAEDIESISRDFGAACETSPRREIPGDLGPAVRMRNAGEAPASPQWPRRNLNLPLAAGPRVRHIRAHGAVAEWLKAAVC